MKAAPAGSTETAIPGIPTTQVERLLRVLTAQPHLKAVWLFGSRAMERHNKGSDIDLCLEGTDLSHGDRLQLMAAVDDLLLPWKVDLVLRDELAEPLEAHVRRVGRRIWPCALPSPG